LREKGENFNECIEIWPDNEGFGWWKKYKMKSFAIL
jgi:hypothetical protein